MNAQEAMAIIRSGKNGSQILDLLDKIVSLSDVEETSSEVSEEIVFADWHFLNCPPYAHSIRRMGYYFGSSLKTYDF